MTFWTPRKLIKLRVLARTKSISQLAQHFHKAETEIIRALHFEEESRRLKVGIKKERIEGKMVKITVYAPEYAAFAKPVNVVRARNYWV